MSKKILKLVCIVLSMVMLIGLAACGTPTTSETPATTTAASAAPADTTVSAAAPVTYKVLTHYSTPDEKAPMDWAIAEIAKTMPNVTFEIEAQLNDNGDSLKARIATGDLPDIFLLSPSMFDAAINSKSILNLTDAVTSTGLDKKFVKSLVDTQLYYKDKQCWAFPINAGGVDLLYYNKDMFAANNIKVPTNYPEFLAAVKGFAAKGIVPLPLYGKEAWPIGAFLDSFLTKVNPEGMLALNNGTAKASDYKVGITKLAECVKAGIFEKGATSTDYDTARAMFEHRKSTYVS